MKIKLYMDCLILLTLIVLMSFSTRAQYTDTAKTHKLYYGNGQVKQISHQGIFHGCGVPVGTDSIFSAGGHLEQTLSYSHYIVPGGSCHDIITKQTKTIYYPSGVKKLLQFFMSTYDGEPVPVDSWYWYDKRGKVMREKSFRTKLSTPIERASPRQ